MARLDRIRDALLKQPFEPFVIKMTDGTTCVVRGRDWLSIPPVRRPREVAFYSIPDRGAEDEFQTHWLTLAWSPRSSFRGSAAYEHSPRIPATRGEGF